MNRQKPVTKGREIKEKERPLKLRGATSPEPDRLGETAGFKATHRSAVGVESAAVAVVNSTKPDNRARPKSERRTTGLEFGGGGDVPYDHSKGPEPDGINVEAPRKKRR